jgi:predicted transcriptional regulator
MTHLENHIIVLITYVAHHPKEKQTYESLGEATGIPYVTLYRIINNPDYRLKEIGLKYGYVIKVLKDNKGRFVDAVYWGTKETLPMFYK